jgi:hypothetical protein
MINKLSFDELHELYKKDVYAYRKYIDGCSWDELMYYSNEGLEICEKKIIDSKNLLEGMVNQINLSKFYKK